ncbi:MAG: endopeptidase La [Myxococcales bacterium]|nr:endopeptidase La [Myxococcales bacterium]USN51743.1 MAG: endopeptidase La [Myxococcales bacterium]
MEAMVTGQKPHPDTAAPSNLPSELPILPLRNSVFFPGAVMPLTIGRTKTIRLIEEATKEKSLLGIITQRAPEIDDPGLEDMYKVGTAARIIKLARAGKDGFNIVVEGVCRFKVDEFNQTDPFFTAKVSPLVDEDSNDVEVEALSLNLRNTAREVIDLLPEIPVMAKQLLDSISAPGHLADLITANIDATIEEKQDVLEAVALKKRLVKVLELLNRQFEVLKLSNKINTQVKGEMSKTQREYYLRQQLKAIREELGEKDDEENGLEELKKRLKDAELSEEAQKAAKRELKRMSNMQPSQAEYTVARTYLDWLADLPWTKSSKDNLNLTNAKKILDHDHYGLDRIKKRIIEYLAVRKLKDDMKGPILCFLGPPGVGKTSLGRSIAQALGRKFYRMSLGGVRDEAEIRGHRRTYIGALPGRIIQGMKKAGMHNPVFLLDEIDKLGNDFRGDPSSALLEVLDPEQNSTFSDHYLDVPFDLSKVLFIATANETDTIPAALKDRMEVIELPGYTYEEKLNIAKRHLIPKQILAHGISDDDIEIPDESIMLIAHGYTREAGVRNFEREVAAVCRYIAVLVAKHKQEYPDKAFGKVVVDKAYVEKILGPERFYNESAERTSIPGIATGLAWTAAGGDLLFIEATRMGGKGSLILTGKLGEVMKESAQTALSWVRSKASDFSLASSVNEHFLDKTDIHIHFPAGAIPKDGPSAGVTIITALVSLLTGRRTRANIAMTGEVTLRGLVLPVGGIKEKVLAAHRAGIKQVIMPARNQKDLDDIPKNVRSEIKFVFAKNVDDVLEAALMPDKIKKKSIKLPASSEEAAQI